MRQLKYAILRKNRPVEKTDVICEKLERRRERNRHLRNHLQTTQFTHFIYSTYIDVDNTLGNVCLYYYILDI